MQKLDGSRALPHGDWASSSTSAVLVLTVTEDSLPAADCRSNDWDYPCYVTRGRWDDGAYVSVDEAYRFFDGEERGYLVILASGPKGNPLAQAVVEEAQALLPAAELRTDDVSEGCVH